MLERNVDAVPEVHRDALNSWHDTESMSAWFGSLKLADIVGSADDELLTREIGQLIANREEK